MGFRRPTPIQQHCIPAILSKRDVMGCAETGSGKTATFALPILNELSDDPYGIFAVVLTPTRELAMQIAEQFGAFGSPIGLRLAVVIGGNGIVEQSLALSRQPHVVIATPGRLRHHISGAEPPSFRMTRYLVLDEADRLLASGFETDLEVIFAAMPTKKNTLLFSATLTESLDKLSQFTSKDTLRFDLTSTQKVPDTLIQQYLFMPRQVKTCYLIAVLQKLLQKEDTAIDDGDDNAGTLAAEGHKKRKREKGSRKTGDNQSIKATNSLKSTSVIIFTSSCLRCQEISEIILNMKIDCLRLHSLMHQVDRTASLSKFKSQICNILVATDVASRGLDIPQVDLVINFDLPKVCADYIHRVGRTARAGRHGRSLSLLTPHDIDLVHAIEEYIEVKLSASSEVVEDDILPLLNPVAKAIKEAQLKLMESGFDEKVEINKKRKKKQKKQLLRLRSVASSNSIEA
jgi:ATP-dependent RNA helicase DDX49/DBP8